MAIWAERKESEQRKFARVVVTEDVYVHIIDINKWIKPEVVFEGTLCVGAIRPYGYFEKGGSTHPWDVA